ncbi:hypothetical protein D3C87_1954770 [compost metagenome]
MSPSSFRPAMPMDAVMTSAPSACGIENGWLSMIWRNRSATAAAISGGVSGMTTTNSSPPKRQARSAPRTVERMRLANSRNTSSPTS